MNICANESYLETDKELNETYNQLKQQVDESFGNEFLSAQRAWLAFRDAECGLAAAATRGGSIQPMILSACLERLTKDRTAQLKAHLDCEEGQLHCVKEVQ